MGASDVGELCCDDIRAVCACWGASRSCTGSRASFLVPHLVNRHYCTPDLLNLHLTIAHPRQYHISTEAETPRTCSEKPSIKMVGAYTCARI